MATSDRHRPGYWRDYRQQHPALDQRKGRQRPSRSTRATKKPTPWKPIFRPIDGEAFHHSPEDDGFYGLLAIQNEEPLLRERILHTKECLDYITQNGKRSQKEAIVGYGLGYDFENILRDIPNEEAQKFRDGEEVEYAVYHLKYIRNKILMIKKLPSPYAKKQRPKEWWVCDAISFFQSSFVKALEKWHLDKEEPELYNQVVAGKADRSDFRWEDRERIIAYNQAELTLLEKLMHKLLKSFQEAFQQLHLPWEPTPRLWYGPGAFAGLFLKYTHWQEEHPAWNIRSESFLSDEELARWFSEPYDQYPFSNAYEGGRIEESAAGFFLNAEDADINSAYPWAISLLPKWKADDLQSSPGDQSAKRLMGMYRVEWHFNPEHYWNPFPYRLKHGVFFPPTGSGWVMSPEVYAAQDTDPDWREHFTITHSVWLNGTDHWGDGLTKPPEYRLSTTAKTMAKLAEIRLEAKKVGLMMENALKLIMNSEYGKVTQQVGSHLYFSDFASAWITSVCRSMIWRAIAPERATRNVIAVKTDGILSLTPLPFVHERIGSALGQFEVTPATEVIQLLPGIYEVRNPGQPPKPHVRGFGRDFDFEKGLSVLIDGTGYGYTLHVFVSRWLAAQWRENQSPLGKQYQADERAYKTAIALTRRQAREEWQAQHRHYTSLIAIIKELGGILPSSNPEWETGQIPIAVRSRSGRTAGEIAESDTLQDAGWHFESDDALMQALASNRAEDFRDRFIYQRVQQLRQEPDIIALEESLNQRVLDRAEHPQKYTTPVHPYTWVTLDREFSIAISSKRIPNGAQGVFTSNGEPNAWFLPRRLPGSFLIRDSAPYPLDFPESDFDRLEDIPEGGTMLDVVSEHSEILGTD